MFEISIFCVILLAIVYWVALWLMGRHDDVLHGDFVHAEEGGGPAAAAPPTVSQPPLRHENSDLLQSLLAAIKRDLDDAARI